MQEARRSRNEDHPQPSTAILDDQFVSDVLVGLSGRFKSLPCKYLYDKYGSQLFDQICELEEYYPTRTETQITHDNAVSISECLGRDAVIVEYGSGSSTKTRVLLDHLDAPNSYLPVDISEDHLLNSANLLSREYPELDIRPIVADFTSRFSLPEDLHGERICVYFPGSTIGNFVPAEAIRLLRNIAWQCGLTGSLLIGVDLRKSRSILELAYNDPRGVTAEFNLNLLRRINRECDGNFDLGLFRHVGFYNEAEGRIEIYLESLERQSVEVSGEVFFFREGERIHTEYSHKYTVDGFTQLAGEAGFQLDRVWTDERDYFALMHLTVD